MGQPLGWALPLQGALRAPSPAHIKAQAWSWARRGRSVCQGPRGFHDHHIPSASCQELALADPLELLSVGEGWGQGRAGWPGADPALRASPPGPRWAHLQRRRCLEPPSLGTGRVTQPGASFLPWDSTQSFLWPETKSIRRQHWAATGTAMTKVPTRVSSSRPVGSSGCPRWQSGQPGTEAPALGRTLPKLGLPIHPKGPVRPRLRASSGRRWLRPSSGTTSSRQRPALVLLRRAAMPLPPTLPQCHPLCLLFLRGCSPRHHP